MDSFLPVKKLSRFDCLVKIAVCLVSRRSYTADREGRPGAALSESGVLGTRDTSSVKNYIICKFQINDQVVLRWTSEHSECKLNLD